MTKASIVTAAEVLDYLAYANHRLTESKFGTSLMKMVRTRIYSFLMEGETPIDFDEVEELDDNLELIWGASLAICLEYLCQRGQVQQTSGDVHETQVGGIGTKFQKGAPLFFFAQGASAKFKALLPHDTYRMQAYEYLQNYKSWWFRKVSSPGAIPYGSSSARLSSAGVAEYFESGDDAP